MRLRIAMQEQQWRPAPTDKRHDACVFGIDFVPLEALEHGRGSPSIAWRPQHTPIELGAVVRWRTLRTIKTSQAIRCDSERKTGRVEFPPFISILRGSAVSNPTRYRIVVLLTVAASSLA
jgi:hypothetical protein